MTLEDLTVSFGTIDRTALLSDWQWLIGSAKTPVLLTAGGDAFLQDSQDGSVHILDVKVGTLSQVAISVEQFHALLASKEFVAEHFAVQMVGNLRSRGDALEPGQIYSFKHPPVLGGSYELSNIESTDIEVHFSILGQIHRQTSTLPVGTLISGVSIK